MTRYAFPFKKYSFEIACLLPMTAFLFVFTLLPILRVWYLSFSNLNGMGFTLSHYLALLGQADFQQAFFNTLIIALFSVTLEIVFGLVMALLLSNQEKFKNFLRPIFILPLAVPTVVVAVMMSYLFSSSGWINRILADIGLFQTPIAWMDGGTNSLLMIIAADCWKVTPLVMLILLAGLESIDQELYKAARSDGANSWTIFKSITLPLLLPSITTAVIIRGIDAFRIFALVLILMGENLKVVGTYAYLEYMDYHNIHLSAAASVLLFLMILSAMTVYLRIVGKKGLAAY